MPTSAGVLEAKLDEVAETVEHLVFAVLENAVDIVHRKAQAAIRPAFT